MALEPPAHTGESGHRQFPAFGEHLLARFTADDGLKMTDHRGIGMRADRRTEHIEGIGISDPRGERLVHGFLERALAGKRGHDLRAEHLHADDVQALALHVLGTHVHGALQPEQAAVAAVATPCCPAPVSATIRFLPIRFASRHWPNVLLILCAPRWFKSSRLR